MAAGMAGMVTALLLYTLILGFIPSKVGLDLKHAENKQQLFSNGKIYFSSMDLTLLLKQTINNKPSIGYGKYLVAMTFIYPQLYKQLQKKKKNYDKFTTTMDQRTAHHNLFNIHPCPGPHRVTLEGRPGEEHTTTVLQVCPLYDVLQCGPVLSNLPCPSPSFGAVADGAPGRCAGAGVQKVVDRRAQVSRAGVAGVRRVLGGSGGAIPRSDDLAGTSGGPHVSAGLARPRSSETISRTCASHVPIVMQNVNRKRINPGIAKNRKWEVFQTVNHSRTVWDPRAKPKGLLGGHLNIRSLLSKSEQIQQVK
ncbi:uncharacterized protein LOC119897093 [Micropterus salmoides]|uniref:uncharacterized protein LOC119897093 n=1 Tax=Micropterus salmoides TaxID=27706 RepID=UPI0018EC691A|nr:uncharacterized protein LOC119897093 [Micropterus salmoides]